MKRFVLVMLCLLVVSGCFEENNAWMYGTSEGDGMLGGRVGTEVVQNIEIGASAQVDLGASKTTTTTKTRRWCKTTTTTTTEERDRWSYGAHALMHFPDLPLEPYAGGQVNIGEGQDIMSTIQPIGGVNIGPAFAEYQHKSLSGEKDKLLFGIRLKF